MGLLNRFKLYNEDKTVAMTVIPNVDNTRFNLLGIGRLKHIKRTVNKEELNAFIITFNLLREEELGQINIFEIL